MIIGLILRNFKVYKNIQCIPLSTGSNFNGLIGKNGVGKSSVLEALDCFFNKKEWTVNIDNSTLSESWVMPVIALKKADFDFEDLTDTVLAITDYILSDELPTDPVVKKNYGAHIEWLKNSIPEAVRSDHYILPICIDGFYNVGLGIFNYVDFKNKVFGEGIEEDALRGILLSLYDKLNSLLTYVYVPKDIEHARFVAFENMDMQRLIGKNLTDIVSDSLSKTSIQKISSDLKGFINDLSVSLGDYRFKAKSNYQPNLKSYKIYDLIIDEFFAVRALYKVAADGKDIPLDQLSSGEKQQAIIKVITRLVTSYRDSNKGLIVAVDEPESSLHVSLCYDQFEKLYDISGICNQVIFTSHWYGFIPTLTSGNIVYISNNGKYECQLFNAENYREEIKHADEDMRGLLPIDVMVKSSNDLVQSILSSIIKEDCYNWLICEGSSDKIYLNAYFEDEITTKRLRIVPACKAKEVKKMYEHLSIAAEELKKNIKGKVFFLIDTDADLLRFDTKDSVDDCMRCRRIVNKDDNTILVKVNSNPTSPKTDIEDALNGKLFHEILMNFKAANEELAFLSEKECEETPSFYALNLGPKDYERMDYFFSKDLGQNKVQFANAYIERMKSGEFQVPNWIQEIKGYFA